MEAIQPDAPQPEATPQEPPAPKNEQPSTVNAAADRISSLIDGSPPEGETPPVVDEAPTTEPEVEAAPEEPTETPEPEEVQEVMTHLTELADHLGVEEDFLETLVIPTKINGETKDFTLKDIKANFQKSEAADLKLMDLAEKRKNFDSELETAKGSLQQEWSQVQALNAQLQASLGQTEDLTELRETDPSEYAARVADRQLRMDAAGKIQGEMQKANSDKLMTQYQEKVQSERPKLLNAIPEWQDDKTMEKENLRLRTYLKDQGFQDLEIDGKVENSILHHTGIIDHRQIVAYRKAMLYDESLKGSEPKKARLKTLPKVSSGKPKPKVDKNVEQAKEKRKRFKKSGSQQDAAAIIYDIMNS